MEAGLNLQRIAVQGFTSNLNKGNRGTRPNLWPGNESGPLKSEDPATRLLPDLKKMATEMLPEQRRMGEFKDHDWVGEAKDLQIGPDIRFAVKSRNPDFLRRIIWGPLTSAEFREVTHRLKELERKSIESNNILKGKIIDEQI